MKSFENILEGVQRARRLKVSAGVASTRLNTLKQKKDSGIFDSIKNWFRRDANQKQLDADIQSLEQREPQLIAARDAAIAKVDRRQLRGFGKKDVSSSANNLRRIVGLNKSIEKHQESLKTETNPQTIQSLTTKIQKAQRNLGRFS